jgi:hypothetical protein
MNTKESRKNIDLVSSCLLAPCNRESAISFSADVVRLSLVASWRNDGQDAAHILKFSPITIAWREPGNEIGKMSTELERP